VADALRNEPEVEVQLIDGKPGEFTVTVNGHMVVRKRLIFKPSVEKIVRLVREAGPERTAG
jgi:hypothetical protein